MAIDSLGNVLTPEVGTGQRVQKFVCRGDMALVPQWSTSARLRAAIELRGSAVGLKVRLLARSLPRSRRKAGRPRPPCRPAIE